MGEEEQELLVPMVTKIYHLKYLGYKGDMKHQRYRNL